MFTTVVAEEGEAVIAEDAAAAGAVGSADTAAGAAEDEDPAPGDRFAFLAGRWPSAAAASEEGSSAIFVDVVRRKGGGHTGGRIEPPECLGPHFS